MTFELLILDFDGTFTDVEAEAAPFFEAYQADARRLLGFDLEDSWTRAAAKVATNPAEYGWTYGGHVVAPGSSDPYLRATVIMNMIFDERGLFADDAERTEVLQGLYHRNYPKAGTVFRPEAKAAIETLLASKLDVCVVTNSATAAVQDKIDALDPKGRERLHVHGDAKKYIVAEPETPHPDFDALPETMRAEHLEREILLRRGPYFTLLQQLWAKTKTHPARTLVAGDIFELDLAMPAHLGAAVHLVCKDQTPAFEKAAIAALGERAAASDDLGAVLDRVL